jgi:hypothetical protein
VHFWSLTLGTRPGRPDSGPEADVDRGSTEPRDGWTAVNRARPLFGVSFILNASFAVTGRGGRVIWTASESARPQPRF